MTEHRHVYTVDADGLRIYADAADAIRAAMKHCGDYPRWRKLRARNQQLFGLGVDSTFRTAQMVLDRDAWLLVVGERGGKYVFATLRKKIIIEHGLAP